MSVKNIILIGGVAIAIPVAVLAFTVLPLLFLVPLFGVGLGAASYWLALSSVALCPLGLFFAAYKVRRFVSDELAHIEAVGKEEALWSVSAHHGANLVVDYVSFVRTTVDAASEPISFLPEYWSAISVAYSDSIGYAARWVCADGYTALSFIASVAAWVYFLGRQSLKVVKVYFFTMAAVVTTLYMSPGFAFYVADFLVHVVFFCTPLGWPHVRLRLEWARLTLIDWLLAFALWSASFNDDIHAHYSERLAGRRRKVGALLRVRIMKGVRVISSVRLPAFVRNRFQRLVNADDLARGRQIMADLGWPVNVDIVDKSVAPEQPSNRFDYSSWHVADTSFATGIRERKLSIKEAMADLNVLVPAYYRTEEYKNVDNELTSTARYFQHRSVDFSGDLLGDVWRIVRPIFAGSKLTKFGDIIYLWEKKYALGFWMTDPSGKRKLSRRSFIASVGLPWFKELWARTFVRASEIMPVAHISVKDEALPPAKYLLNKVRSIIGSPISHYIGSTLFSHWPNHHFDFDQGPIKVGMPLNGYWMGRVFDRHARFNVHVEGDFSDFDSTIEGPVKDVIRAVRKMGFVDHKDHAGICELIDAMYDQIDQQFLGMTSTGAVYAKGSGLTTGHSSTSMDNSLATVIFYMAAWKSLTGLSAREFVHFNELSCYGDDHMLSIQATAPRAWTASNIRKTMASWGVVNNVLERKLRDMTFLGKLNSPVTPALADELSRCGVTGVQRAIWHDKQRLIGKLTAKIKSGEPTYRATRLVSYLQLTAHHPEIYRAIVRELAKEPLATIVKHNFGPVPSYESIVRNWYRPDHKGERLPGIDAEELWENDGRMLIIGAPSLLDHVLQALSLLPDLLNPVLFNYGPTRAVVGHLSGHLSWVPTLIRLANGLQGFANLDYHLKRTPYDFIDLDLVQVQRFEENFTSLVVRHWLFCLYLHFRPKFPSISVLSFALRKSAEAAFVFKGQVITDLPRDVFPFDKVLICAILSWVRCPPLLDFLVHVDVPDIAAIFDTLWNRVLAFVWTSVPANFSEVDALVVQLDHANPLLIEAPTGSGKSTALLAHLHLTQVQPHRKLVVVEPRSMLAIGLQRYVADTFGVWTTAATTGSTFDPRASVWFMTPQSFLGHLHLMTKHDLFVIDEAHLKEPLVPLLVDLLPRWGFKTILATATPSAANLDAAARHVSIPISNVYTSTVVEESIPSTEAYIAEALYRVNAMPRHVRSLVLCDTPELCEKAASQSKYTTQILSSKHSPVVLEVDRYFATSVVDVGVTIPGLQVFVSPGWVYHGDNRRAPLDDATYRQRRGRVGRTNNGQFIVLKPSTGSLVSMPDPTRVDSWREVLAAGISPVLGWELAPDVMSELFGLGNIDAQQRKDFARVSHIFLTNFRQLKALELEQSSETSASGRPAVMVPTGSLGHFSSSVPQDLASAHDSAMAMCTRLLGAIKKGDAVFDLLKEKLANVRAGPLYRVSNLVLGLSNDPGTWRPELLASASSAEDVDFDLEIQRIHDILDVIKGA